MPRRKVHPDAPTRDYWPDTPSRADAVAVGFPAAMYDELVGIWGALSVEDKVLLGFTATHREAQIDRLVAEVEKYSPRKDAK